MTNGAHDTEAALMKAYELGAAGTAFESLDGDQIITLPMNWRAEKITHNHRAPYRATGTAAFADVESLHRYVELFVTTGTLLCRRSWGIEVILDHHEKDLPGHNEWRALFRPELSAEWLTWKLHNEQPMAQEAFANFIEDNLEDIETPDGATMLEIATTLEATTQSRIEQATGLKDGKRHIVFSENVEAKAGADGQLTIPDEFTVKIPIFALSTMTVTLRAKLRFRRHDGKLSYHYKLLKPEKAEQKAIDACVKRYEEISGVTVLNGFFTK